MTGTVPLLLLSALVTGVLSWRPKEVYIKAGEMVALWCPHYKGFDDTNLIWTNHTDQETGLSSSMSSAEQRKMGVLLHERTLVILSANINHQGNYSCSYGNVSRQFWFRLTVYTTQSREYEEKATYSKTCYTQESCTLNCPDVGLPAVNTPNMTRSGLSWHKKGESRQKVDYFNSVEENDQGVYICTRSYSYNQHTYKMTFAVALDVHPRIISGKTEILSPHHNEVFHVDLGLTVVIECKAVIYSDFDEVFWLSGTSFVERNDNLPVFYNSTRENAAEEMKVTASLIFKKVSKEDIKRKYTCKLESDDQPSSFATITLAQKDGKSHDVSLTNYKSVTDAGPNEVDRERQENV
ncbi:interleukin-1 receptor accessory protein-like [Cheilinus undulatus]|uniref:interleukin-1 receptor accessory protein-like n=1 Tax=Cheilinus undulatus TaxID=241271 RepID=UPI001BD1C372|nr:interleukin-1 receptor accessory protein-like [Cheilinus undulatus]